MPGPVPEREPGQVPEPAPSGNGARWILIAAGSLLLILGGFLALTIGHFGCNRSPQTKASSTFVPGEVSKDSIGTWVDQGDSLLGLDLETAPQRTRAGFDFWARAVAASLRPEADTLPDLAEVQKCLDSLYVKGEVARATGNAGAIGVNFRPHSASHAHSAYFFYVDHGRVGFLPTGLDNMESLQYAGWRQGPDLQMGAVGSRSGMPPALAFLKQLSPGTWAPWDTLPTADSLGAPGAVPSFDEGPDGLPLLVFRYASPGGPFEECPTCPHRYFDRVWRLDKFAMSSLGDQLEETPYAVMVSFIDAMSRGDTNGAAHFALDGGAVEKARQLPLDSGNAAGGWRLAPGQIPQDSVLTVIRRGAGEFVFRLRTDSGRWKVESIDSQGL